MSTYSIWDNTEVSDPAKLQEYKRRVEPLVAEYGGVYRVVGGNFKVMEGEWPMSYPVIIEFPTMERALEWYNSAEYQELKALRQSASKANAIFIDAESANSE